MARRTRACEPCRKRRIKCDERFPRCEQCIRKCRACPGPLQGPLMVDMTSAPANQSGKIHKPQARIVNRALEDNGLASIATLPWNPSHRHVMTQLLVSRFLTFFCGGESAGLKRKSWMLRLPHVSTKVSVASTVELSLQAAALAHYAAEAGQRDAMIQSSQVYTKAIGSHCTSVCVAQNENNSDPALAFRIVSSNLVLAYFEAIQCTTLEGYGMHINAAATFLETLGPVLCKTNPLNQLFFAVRSQMVFVTAVMRFSLKFDSQDWIDVPWNGRRTKPIFERVVDAVVNLLSFPEINGHNPTLNLNKAKHTTFSLELFLENLWNEFKNEGIARGEPIYSMNDSGARIYRDAITAVTITYFNLAWLMILSVSPRIAHASSDVNHVVSHNSIFSCIAYIETKSIGCAFMRMMLPISFIALKSPFAAQRQNARDILERWKIKRIMTGLCTILLLHIDRDSR